MDKNKNRTDLLAAGRKKLQQYRQKKDGKGSKSSGKVNKSDPDVITDESTSVAKPTKGKKEFSETEVSAQDSAAELVDSSNFDMVTPDLSSASDLPTEVSETDVPISTLVQDENLKSSNLDGTPSASSLKAVNIEGKTESDYVSVTPVGLNVVADGKAGEIKAASGEDQVPDVGALQERDHSWSGPDTHISLIDHQKDDKDQVNSGEFNEDTKMEYTDSAPKQTTEPDHLGVNNIDLNSSTGLQSSDREPTSESKEDDVAGLRAEGGIKVPHRSGDSEFSPVSLTQLAKALQFLSEDEFRFVMAAREAVSGGDLKNDGDKSDSVEFSDKLREQLYINNFEKELTYIQLCEELDARREIDYEKSSLSASLCDVEGKNTIFSKELAACRSELDRVAGEMEKLQIELNRSERELSNVSSELVDSRNSLSEMQVKNENLSVNVSFLTEEKQKLEKEKGDLNLENEVINKELMECKPLLELLQVESANIKESLALALVERAKLDEEKENYVSENERLVQENKKFAMDLLESHDLVESLRSEIAKLNVNLELVTKEKAKLGEEVNRLTVEKEEALTELTSSKSLLELLQEENSNLNEQLVRDNKRFSLKVSESQNLVESLRSEIAKLSENLDLVTKEKTRFGEEVNQLTVEKEEVLSDLTNCKSIMESLQAENTNLNEQFIRDNNKFSSEVSESQHLVESLRAEIARLSEILDLVIEEKTRLGEEVNRLTVEKGEALAGLNHCNTLTNDLHVEYEKSMIDLKDRAHLLEKLTEENANLTSTLHMYKAKIMEAENASELFKVKRRGKTSSDNKLEEQNDSLEEIFLKNVILEEYVKQYVFTIESKKGELVMLCENLSQEMIIARTKNSELTEKLSNFESRVQKLQEQMDELQLQADHMTENNKDLEGRNELASYVIHKVFNSLQKIVENSGPSIEQSDDDTTREQLDHLEISNYDVFIEKLIMILDERAQLESKNREYNLELLRKMKDMDELNKRCINPDVIFKFFEDIQHLVPLKNIEIKPDEPLSSLGSIIHFLIKKLQFNVMKLIDLQNEIDHLAFSTASYEIQSHVLKGSLITAMEQIVNLQSETQLKEAEFCQSEQRVSALREKLHIAVTKGKGLIQQRESLKQNLTATSNELEKCLHELQLKDATLQETERKLKTYSEAGERMEALESELSYIRNSATALRESFLLKDSVLQRIEEILEDLDLPEDFHVRDIIDKIDWLAKSVSQSQTSLPVSNQLGSIGRTRSYPESGSRALGGWTEDLEPSSGFDDELRRNYEELQNKFYGLAEQNEMLEQSLMERNNLVQRWEEVLNKINMPPQFRSLEPEDRINWLRAALLESNDRCSLLEQDISELEKIRGSLAADLEESQRRLVDLESALKVITDEHEQLSASLEVQIHDYNKISEKAALYEVENEKLQNEVGTLHLKFDEKCVDEEQLHGEIRQLQDLVKETLQISEVEDLDSNTSDIQCLEGLVRRLVDKQISWYGERSVDQSNMHEELERKLEVDEGDLVQEKNERERLVEKNQALFNEVEALEAKNQELQNLLVQEEHKTAMANEKLNMHEELHRKLEAVEGDLGQVQDEREQLMKKCQTLIIEVEALEVKNQELRNLLVQEEHNTAIAKEKLNMHEELHRKLEAVEGDLGQVKDERELLMEKCQTLIIEVEALEVKNQELRNLLVQEEQKTLTIKEKLNMHEELERKLEVVEGDLVQVKDERERLREKCQTLIDEVEALEIRNQELKNLLVQEEQKTATIKEKLNVAVRRGKSLVQVRDSMKQTINDLTSQVDHLNDEIRVRESTILEIQQKMKDLFVSQEMVENKDSEIQFLKNRLEGLESELQDKRNSMSMILGALAGIDHGVDLRTNDPLEKMKQIGKVMQDLQAAMLSAEQDSKKSKRAAELLLAELNEVQERNEDLLEEISELSKQKDSHEASMRESLTRFEQLSALHLEERSSQISELMNLKSGLEQLRPGLSKIYNLLNNVLPKDLDYLHNIEAGAKSLMESSDAFHVGGQTLNSSHGGISSRSESKVNSYFKSFFDSKTEELHNDDNIVDLWRFVGSHMQDLITNISSYEEKLQSHSKSLRDEVIHLCEKVPTLYKEITSQRDSLDSAKEEIAWLESTGKQKETENVMLRKYTTFLYEACKNSVLEIEKSKGHMVANDSFNEEILSGEIDSFFEEGVTSIANRLLSVVKDFNGFQTENVEANLKELKATISTLQQELTEKDVQKDRISVELVSQIKQAEAAAMNHLQELEAARAQIIDLKGHCNLLEQRVKELEDQESILVDLQEQVKSLSEALTVKEQENEALLQALDEEEAQMEGLTNKITELETLVQQKDVDLESTEAARGKALKKLSVTVSKFDELHHLSETLVSEVDNLQSQLQERDSEISFLRDEITRITSDSLQALTTDERSLKEVQDILTWLNSMAYGVEACNVNLDDNKKDLGQDYKEILKKQIASIILELKNLRQVAQSKDDQLRIERSKVDELMHSLREKESRLSLNENDSASAQSTSMTSEIVEVEPLINKWPSQGTSMAPQVRSLRKVNNDQLAISIDEMDSDDRDKLDDDDDKAHGFKSLTTSKLVPRFTRPVTDFVDGLWVSCDRTLMRQPALRLSLILYWALMHALLAVFVV
ncbi:hypothetical protein R6Q59_022175 [Mikania micrantha]